MMTRSSTFTFSSFTAAAYSVAVGNAAEGNEECRMEAGSGDWRRADAHSADSGDGRRTGAVLLPGGAGVRIAMPATDALERLSFAV